MELSSPFFSSLNITLLLHFVWWNVEALISHCVLCLVSWRAHHVSDYLLAGIEGCGYKDQACFFVAHHDDSGGSGCSCNFSKTYPSFLTFFRKPTRPSLPLRKAPPLISVFFNSLYDPFGSPCRGQKPQGRRRKPPYSADFSTSPSLLQGELHL